MLRRFNCLRVRFRCCWCRVCLCSKLLQKITLTFLRSRGRRGCRRRLTISTKICRRHRTKGESVGNSMTDVSEKCFWLWQTAVPSASSFVHELTLKWNAAARGYISHTCFLFKPKQQQIYKRDRNAKSSFHILNNSVLLTLWKLKKVIFCLNIIEPRAHVSSINR